MGHDPKLLFVLSADYGELSNAEIFSRGQPFTVRALMPERLFGANRDRLPLAARPYGSLADILAEVEDYVPDLVLLFSGYLYAINGVLPIEAVAELVQRLRARDVRMVVSDPFLGLLHRNGPPPFSDRHPRRDWLTEHFGRLARTFAAVPHLYLAPPAEVSSVPQMVFFNPHMLLDAQQRTVLAERLRTLGLEPTHPRWVFVLAAEDYAGQTVRWEAERFEALLVERLVDAVRAGAEALLIAPSPCTERIAAARLARVHVMPFLDHQTFSALLLLAENAFYWNQLSNSATARLANRLPVFYFDRGHMANAIPPLFDLAMQSYFPGAQLRVLDLLQPLDPAALRALAASQRDSLAHAYERLRSAPAPRRVVETLLAAPC